MGVRLCATGPVSDSLRQAVPLCVSSACALTLGVPVDDLRCLWILVHVWPCVPVGGKA